jgi:hypothetical protein
MATLLIVLVVVLLTLGLYLRMFDSQPRKRKKSKRHPRQTRRTYTYYDDDEPYDSPLGLVDHPEDKWIEYEILDDMFFDD